MERKTAGGQVIPGKCIADEDMPFNRFVKQGSSENKYLLCDAGERAIGVVENDPVSENLDGTERTGFERYDPIAIKYSGPAIVEAGEQIDLGDLVKPGANGVAVKYTVTTAGASYSQTEVQTIANQQRDIRGICIKNPASKSGDLITILLLNMG